MSIKKLKPVSRVTLGEQVATQLSESISEGRWGPGDKLPSESVLCATLQIGRSTLREALRSLAYVGLVEMRPGEGTYVLDRTQMLAHRSHSARLLTTEKDLRDATEARLVIETELAAFAAERWAPPDLQEMEGLMEAMRLSLDREGSEYAVLDLDFHLAIAKSSKNRLLYDLLVPIRAVLQEFIVKSQELPGIKQKAHEYHLRILAALRQRNPEKARREMRAHLKARQKAYTLLERISPAPAESAFSAD